MSNTAYVRFVLLIPFKAMYVLFSKMTERRKKFMIPKQQHLNVNLPLQSAQQLLPAMQKYTGKSNHSTEKKSWKKQVIKIRWKQNAQALSLQA